MTKNEAIKLAQQGAKIGHISFLPGEYITIQGNTVTFEDGVECSLEEFFKWRQGTVFEKDWFEMK